MALYAFDAVVLCFSLRFFLLFLFVLKNKEEGAVLFSRFCFSCSRII